ncbi:MAG TPA: glycosyltransferase family 2 protein [Desulfobacteraceae bacterium]|nr:glycosyltransferase family 2 protein [Desulfobacteraceae bacterium]
MNRPAVSVVITTMNRSKLVLKAIRSVFSQTFTGFDLHVVDDGSDDDTPQAVMQVLGGRKDCFYWRHDQRRGLCAARNTGIKKSSGDYIAFLDDDDEWKPDSLEKRMAAVQKLTSSEREKLGVVYSGCENHNINKRKIYYSMPRVEGNIATNAIRAKWMFTIPSTGLYPRKALKEIGGFDESIKSSVDHDLWMALASHGFNAVPVYEALTVRYSFKRRKSMVNDTIPRIQGVEKFLYKWRPLYENWFGKNGSLKYIKYYRTKVLGRLAARKMSEGEIRDAWRLLIHITRRNGIALIEHFRLLLLVMRMCVREFLPLWVIDLAKGRKD